MAALLLTTGLNLAAEDKLEIITGTDEDARNQELDTVETADVQQNKLNKQSLQEKSVKMIVGGQSEDGVAKETTIPVKD